MSVEKSNIKNNMDALNEHAPKVMIVAGEASGDLHGSFLVREMLAINPSLHFYGIGGNKMKEAGVRLLVSSADIAVVGISEVVFKSRNIY